MKQGRPPIGSQRTSLGPSLEGLALRLMLRRMRLKPSGFSSVMGVSRGTVSRWLSSRARGPSWLDIGTGLQVACSGRPPTPLHQPSAWVRIPEQNNKKHLKTDHDDLLIDIPLLAAMSVQRHLGTAPVARGHAPIMGLDRLAATASVENQGQFVTMMKNTLNPVHLGGNSLYRWAAKTTQGLFIQAGPRFQNPRIDPNTGELLEPHFIRVDIPGRLIQNAPLLTSLMSSILHPVVNPSSWETTLIDFAATYDEPHFAILNLDRRARTVTVRRPQHESLRELAINTYFGSKTSARYVRCYNKQTEVADKLLSKAKDATALLARLHDEFAASFDGFDDDELPDTAELDGDGLMMALQADEKAAWKWPSSIRRWSHAHRIEGSVRPRSLSSDGAIDRHPAGLAQRIVDHANPFTHHQVVHLGLVAPDSAIAPILVWTRVEGMRSVQRDIDAVSRTPAEGHVFRTLFLDELDRLADATEWHGLEHPDLLLRRHADELQQVLDKAFSTSGGATC